MRNVALITYYFPPLGMAGSVRPLKWAKYLPSFGWRPHVLTLVDRPFYARDASLLDEFPREGTITRTWGLDPFVLFGERQTSGRRPFVTGRKAAWLLPDNKVGWLPWGLVGGLEMIARERCEAIVATGPPFTTTVLGAMLAAITGLPLWLDYRDSWTNNSAWNADPRPVLAARRALERWTLRHAQGAIAVNPYIADDLRATGALDARRIHVIRNGYDPADVDLDESAPMADGLPLRLAYAGALFDGLRSPRELFEALRRHSPDDVRLTLIGRFPPEAHALAEDLHMAPWLEWWPYMERRACLRALRRFDALALISNRRPGTERETSSKLFDHFACQRPTLGIVPPEGDAGQLIAHHRAGWSAEPSDVGEIAALLGELIARKRVGPLRWEGVGVEVHSRIRQTEALAALLSA